MHTRRFSVMKMSLAAALAFGAIAIGFSTGADAQPYNGGATVDYNFNRLDRTNNGVLTRADFLSRASYLHMLRTADYNGDQMITLAEYRRAMLPGYYRPGGPRVIRRPIVRSRVHVRPHVVRPYSRPHIVRPRGPSRTYRKATTHRPSRSRAVTPNRSRRHR